MARSRIVIVNGTDGDAVCRVSGGSGAPGGVDIWKWRLPKKQNLAFSVEIGNEATNLKLTENSKGYQLEIVGADHPPKPKPKPKPRPRGLLRESKSPSREPKPSLRAPSAETIPTSPELEEIEAVANERSELLFRKHSGETLTSSEQVRLESLTAKLKELVPLVPPGALEALREMAEDAERIRKRARERRQRLGLNSAK